MILLNGKKLAEKILPSLKKEIKSRHLKLRLAVILVGENPISQIFTHQKEKAAEKVGIEFKLYKFSTKISPQNLKEKIGKIVRDPANSGVVIQLPLPKKFFAEKFLNLVPEEKDVDCLSEKCLGRFYQGTSRISPPTVNGILRLLKNYKIRLKGKNIVIVGAGRLVGLPLAVQLLKEKATLSVLNEFTKDTPFFTKKADILISGVGKPNLIRGDMVRKGVVVIDAGTSLKKGKPRRTPPFFRKERGLRGRLVGDVNFESVSKKASYISPVPGGVGPMTVACLLENLVKLCLQK